MLCGFISTAPLAAEMRELIETCIDAPLFDIYGLTEVAGVARDGVIARLPVIDCRLLKPVTLELGGKSAAIILDDADPDLETVGQDLFTATLLNNGQTCFLGTRVLAPRTRYTEIVDLFTASRNL